MAEPVQVKYRLEGSPEMYWRKVYGEQRVTSVSPEELGGEHQAWDIRDAYNQLWDIWWPQIKYGFVGPEEVHTLKFKEFLGDFDAVVSTIPRMAWCKGDSHDFKSTLIYAIGDAPELGITVPIRPNEDNSVICNGLPDVGWYRLSRVFGHNTMEWPGRRKPPYEHVVPVHKPVSTDCDCWAGEVAFMGRFGEWKKGVLAHQVFEEACNLFTDTLLAAG